MGDLINRQDAINIAQELIIPSDGYRQYNRAVNNYVARLMRLPSTEPQWIFCNEKYPEMDERVLVNLDGYYDCHVWDCMSNRSDDYFWEDECGLYHNKYEVTAWMPYQEPYKKKE